MQIGIYATSFKNKILKYRFFYLPSFLHTVFKMPLDPTFNRPKLVVHERLIILTLCAGLLFLSLIAFSHPYIPETIETMETIESEAPPVPLLTNAERPLKKVRKNIKTDQESALNTKPRTVPKGSVKRKAFSHDENAIKKEKKEKNDGKHL